MENNLFFREDAMPIYEFYCPACNTVFNFYSPTVNTAKIPLCPRCNQDTLERLLSSFATLSGGHEDRDSADIPLDEAKMEKAFRVMEREMGTMNEDDPRQAVSLLRKMAAAAGGTMDEGMEEALRRIEAGDDPETIEAEMGDQLNPESIFSGKKKGRGRSKKILYDETLYDL